MAVELRQTYDLLLTEHLERSAQKDDPNYEERAKDFITQAVFDIGRVVNHRALQKISTAITLTATDFNYTLPTDTQEVVAIKLTDPADSSEFKVFHPSGFSAVLGAQQTEFKGMPEKMAVWEKDIYFDRLPEILYTTELFYWAEPTAPDFVAGAASPVYDRVWDPHIIEYSLVLSGLASGESGVAQGAQQALMLFLQTMPDARITELRLFGAQKDENDRAGAAL